MFLEKITDMAHVFKDALTNVYKENVYNSFELLRPLDNMGVGVLGFISL